MMPNIGGFVIRFVFATTVAVLTVSVAAAQTISPTAAQKKKAVAQKKTVGKMTYNQCVDLAYQRGFSDGSPGGSGNFIRRCMRGEHR